MCCLCGNCRDFATKKNIRLYAKAASSIIVACVAPLVEMNHQLNILLEFMLSINKSRLNLSGFAPCVL